MATTPDVAQCTSRRIFENPSCASFRAANRLFMSISALEVETSKPVKPAMIVSMIAIEVSSSGRVKPLSSARSRRHLSTSVTATAP